MKKKATKSKNRLVKVPRKSREVPINQGMLYEFRMEMVERFNKIDKKNDSVDHRFESIDKRFDSVDEKFLSLEEKIESVRLELKSDINGVKSEIHRLGVLIEEQNAKNNVVLDALMGVIERQDRLEDDYQELRNIIPRGKQV